MGQTAKRRPKLLHEKLTPSYRRLVSGKDNLLNLKFALATINGIGAKDELEGLLAVQMVGVHSLAIECLKRASQEDQTTFEIDANINRATKLLRTFTAQMEALNRHRGKLVQQMVVGNVNVNNCDQAIVGPMNHDDHRKVSRKGAESKPD